jgi:hypothetical protein
MEKCAWEAHEPHAKTPVTSRCRHPNPFQSIPYAHTSGAINHRNTTKSNPPVPKGLAPTPIQPVSTRPRQALSIGPRLTLLAHLLRPSPSPAAQPVTSAYPSASGQATRLRGSRAYTWQPVVRLAVWCMTAMGCWEGVAIEIKTERESSGPELDPILPHWNWSFRWDDYLRIVCR